MRALRSSSRRLLAVTTLAAAALSGGKSGANAGPPAQDPILLVGEVRRLQLETPGDPRSAGVIEIDGTRVAIPPGLLVALPATAMTLPALFAEAPVSCRARNESGVAQDDGCRAHPPGLNRARALVDTTPRSGLSPKPPAAAPVAQATVQAQRDADGRLVASAVAISKNVEYVWGAVSFVNTAEGYVRVNGPYGQDKEGMLLRFNDPFGRQAVQSGLACGTDANCSPDARFRADQANASIRFARGNPACIPSNEVPGLCPESNREAAVEDATIPVPLRPGDHLKAIGAFEIAVGVRFFSAQSLVVETEPRK